MNTQVNTNKDRAESALHALNEWGRYTGDPIEDRVTSIGDLLADMMHLLDRIGVEFDDVVRRARWHHNAEVYLEREQDEELAK